MKKDRIIILDVLRGFALLMIVLIHYVEHFDFFKPPEINFLFSSKFDKEIMKTTLMLISGKAYSIFALLFGLSFFIQMDNKEKRGTDYRWGFLWRMTILFVIGILHSLIYRGDMLHIYALLSLTIIPLYKVNTRYLWVIVILLIMQLPIVYRLVQSTIDSSYHFINPFKSYWTEGEIAYSSGGLIDVVKYNLWKGRSSVYAWSYGNGRFFQLIALFIIGLILGRKKVFQNIGLYKKHLFTILIVSVAVIILLSKVSAEIKSADLLKDQKELLTNLLKSFIDFTTTSALISLLVLFHLKAKGFYAFKLFAAYGKMSLSNYIFQAILGVVLFYEFGFSLYKYLGSTWSIILGCVIFIVQALFSKRWNEKFYYGPIEWFWRCTTNLDFSIRLKK